MLRVNLREELELELLEALRDGQQALEFGTGLVRLERSNRVVLLKDHKLEAVVSRASHTVGQRAWLGVRVCFLGDSDENVVHLVGLSLVLGDRAVLDTTYVATRIKGPWAGGADMVVDSVARALRPIGDLQ